MEKFLENFVEYLSPTGTDFIVNDYLISDQDDVRLTALPGGGFVAVWESLGPNGYGNSIYARKIAADGTPDGASILIASSPVTSNSNPSVAILSDGSWVVAWNTYLNSGTGEILVQIVNSDGTLNGSSFQANSFTIGGQFVPETVALDGGGFLLTWQSSGGDGNGDGVSARFFDNQGTALTSEFVVNDTTAGDQRYSAIAELNNGNIIVSWQEVLRNTGGNATGRKSFAKIIDDTGAAVVSEFALFGGDDYSGARQITVLANGDIAISGWTATGPLNGLSWSSSVQIFSEAGVLKNTVAIMPVASADEYEPKVTATPDGGFVVTATVDVAGSGGIQGHTDIYIQKFDAAGVSVSGPEMVNTRTGPGIYHGESRIETLADGKIAVVWSDYTSGRYGENDVLTRIYDSDYVGTQSKDLLAGSDYGDVMYGRGGNDRILGGKGADIIDGGLGKDDLRGSNGNDKLLGGKGKDALDGGGGKDVLIGGGGGDSLKGQKGNDTLKGGAGKDTLDGGAGNDTLTGGGNSDVFVFVSGRDTVTDFQNDVDTIDLSMGDLGLAGLTKRQVLNQFAEIVAGDAVFDFGNGDTLTIDGVTDLNTLRNDLIL